MRLKFLSATIFMITSAAFCQTPCVNGNAGGFPCDGIDLMSFMPWTDFNATNANDSWGWTDPQDGTEYALVGLRDGVAFVDISNPSSPVYLGKLPTHTDPSLWRDVKTYNNYAFVVSEASGHGMQVFDLTRLRNVTNPPVTFTEDAHYNGFGDAHNVVINEDTGFAYGVGTSTFNGGAHFVDISDPLNPVGAGGFGAEDYTHDAQVVTYSGPDSDYTGREIYVGSNENKVVFVDVTDKGNPQTISTITYTNVAYTHQGWLTEDQSKFILGDEIDELNFGFNTRSVVFDVSDLDNPVFDFEYFGPTPATDHNGYVKGDLFYLANYSAGLRIIDISDIENENFTEVAYFDVYTSNNSAGYEGAWNVYPYFASGNILVTSLKFSDENYVGGMYILRPSLLGTDDVDLSDSFRIVPNPATNRIDISATNAEINSVTVSNVMGSVLFSEELQSITQKTVDISSFAAGIYFVTINNNLTKKIIKK